LSLHRIMVILQSRTRPSVRRHCPSPSSFPVRQVPKIIA
jgi:hypothetical protein